MIASKFAFTFKVDEHGNMSIETLYGYFRRNRSRDHRYSAWTLLIKRWSCRLTRRSNCHSVQVWQRWVFFAYQTGLITFWFSRFCRLRRGFSRSLAANTEDLMENARRKRRPPDPQVLAFIRVVFSKLLWLAFAWTVNYKNSNQSWKLNIKNGTLPVISDVVLTSKKI